MAQQSPLQNNYRQHSNLHLSKALHPKDPKQFIYNIDVADIKTIMPRSYLGTEGFSKPCRSLQFKTLHMPVMLLAV